MIFSLIIGLISGILNGLSDRVLFHPLTLPKWLHGRNWWNTGDVESCRLKYKNNDPKQGAKFFLSTTVLVVLTDGHHAFKALGQILFAIGLNLLIINYDILPNVLPYLWVVGLLIYKIGFKVVYR